MKKILIVVLSLLTLLAVLSCGKKQDNDLQNNAQDVQSDGIIKQNDEISDIPETEELPQEIKNEFVSYLAEEYFLEPIDDYSWEREYPVEKIVLHFTSAVVLSKETPYDMTLIRGIFEDNHLSIHYIIDRDGTIYCYMPENRVAWHAGKGTYANDEKYTNLMNKYSIGIEIVAMGSKKDMNIYLSEKEYDSVEAQKGFTDLQYEALDSLLDDLCERYSLEKSRNTILGHDEYNPDKTDPGELFDYSKIITD